MAYLNIYLTNLGKYNEGELVGEWVELPISDEELQAVFKRIGISDKPDPVTGQYYEEYFITDYESDIPDISIGEYDSIDSLNEIAESIESLSDYELKILKNACEAGFFDIENIEDFDRSRYYFYEDVYDYQSLGEYMIDDIYGGVEHLESETLASNFNMESFGWDEHYYFNAEDYIDRDDEEQVAEACERYGVDDITDITAYDWYDVSEGDDEALGEAIIDEVYGGDVENLDRTTLERYFDYSEYARGIDAAGVGAFTSDGYIEDTGR